MYLFPADACVYRSSEQTVEVVGTAAAAEDTAAEEVAVGTVAAAAVVGTAAAVAATRPATPAPEPASKRLIRTTALYMHASGHFPAGRLLKDLFACSYWKSHPDAIISCIGSLGSILGSLGDVCSAFFGSKLQTLQDALCNTRTDCYGDLLREGTAAYLNSIAAKKQYAYSTQQVKDCIAVALTSEVAAAAQAAMFKKANYACHY
jgi:hypothetical protein